MSLTTSFQRHSANQSPQKISMPSKQSCFELLVKTFTASTTSRFRRWDHHRCAYTRAASRLRFAQPNFVFDRAPMILFLTLMLMF